LILDLSAAGGENFLMKAAPPIFSVMKDLLGWTLDRTMSFPKSVRFTFGQRLDNLALDGLQLVVVALRVGSGPERVRPLQEFDLALAQSNVLWTLCHERGWLNARQLVFVGEKLAELGRMTGGWLKKSRGAA
jgi:hypothetical protein